MNRLWIIIGIILLLFLVPLQALAQEGNPPIPLIPTGGNVVLDTLDWLSPSQEAKINAINQKLDQDGIAQIAVVILNDCGEDKQKFRNELFRSWGIGHADDNDGLLIMICWYGGDESHRSIEQETGYGLEGTLPDILTARVVDELFVPAFQSIQPGNGLVAMVKRYDEILRQNVNQSKPVSKAAPLSSISTFIGLQTFILGVVPGLVIAAIYINTRGTRIQSSKNALRRRRQNKARRYIGRFLLPNLKQWISAEIISLLLILGTLFYLRLIQVDLDESHQIDILFRLLLWWLGILIIVFLLIFSDIDWNSNSRWSYSDDNNRNARDENSNDNWVGSSRNGSTSDKTDFGGGSSGGGGSSKKF